MIEKRLKSIIKKILKEEFSLEARDIPRRNSKTPDFDVIGKQDRYTIELKIKSDDPKEAKEGKEVLALGELVTKSIPLAPRNRLSAIIDEGVQQITGYDSQCKTYHLIWIYCMGRNPEFLSKRFYSTLFGAQTMFSLNPLNFITCYYFKESSFFTHREHLDAAILSYENNVQICVNSLSSRAETFRYSELLKNINQGIRDPMILETTEGAMIADCKFDRKETNKIIDYLRKKYSIKHLQTIDMVQHSAMMTIPKENN